MSADGRVEVRRVSLLDEVIGRSHDDVLAVKLSRDHLAREVERPAPTATDHKHGKCAATMAPTACCITGTGVASRWAAADRGRRDEVIIRIRYLVTDVRAS